MIDPFFPHNTPHTNCRNYVAVGVLELEGMLDGEGLSYTEARDLARKDGKKVFTVTEHPDQSGEWYVWTVWHNGRRTTPTLFRFPFPHVRYLALAAQYQREGGDLQNPEAFDEWLLSISNPTESK